MIVDIYAGKWLKYGGLLYNKDMAKKKFKPFEHDDLELKNALIDYARGISSKTEVEAVLACAMIYASFAEYIAGHLLDNLRHLVYQTTYRDFAAIVYIDQRSNKETRTMNKVARLLRDFEFPDKRAIIELIEEIARSRNNLFHNFALIDEKKSEVFDGDVKTIRESTEELFTKVNTVYAGLQKILLNPEQASELNREATEQKTI